MLRTKSSLTLNSGNSNKEALRLRRLQNENIVRMHDLFEANGTAYYVMDLVDGESLSERMKQLNRPLTEAEVMVWLPQVLHALKAVHAPQIWHLDLKPGNIMMDHLGRAVLIDFNGLWCQQADRCLVGLYEHLFGHVLHTWLCPA